MFSTNFYITIIISFLVLNGCSNQKVLNTDSPKNLILLIGDGMGPGQISLLKAFIKNTQIDSMKDTKYAFEEMSKNIIGISSTHPYGNIVVDSACSATQLAIAQSSRPEMIGLDINGDPVQTILEKAKLKGLSTGLVTDTRITHATPAAFAAHVAKRWNEDTIASDYLKTAPDVLLSGGINRFIPNGYEKQITDRLNVKSKRKDNRNLLKEAIAKNYQIVHSKKDLEVLSENKKLLGLFTNSSMPSAIWFRNNKNNKKREVPTLLEMTKAAVKKLSNNKKGFFLMVEAGQIDWAGHQNDAGSMLNEMLSMNETLNWLTDWVKNDSDTLLVVTADHETGGFGLSYNILDLPKEKKLSGSKFKNQKFKPNYNYGKYINLDRMYYQKNTFRDIWTEFKALKKTKQTARMLKTLVERDTGFSMSLKKAQAVLMTEINEFRNDWHYNLKPERLPLIHDFREYYTDTPNVISALIGRGIAAQQNVIWGTGGHTAVPVHVYSLGSKDHYNSSFSGQMTHPILGMKLQRILNLE